MTILSDQMDSVITSRTQAGDLLQAYQILKNASSVAIAAANDVQLIIDNGSFDTIPVELKAELLQWFNIFNSGKTTIEGDAGITELRNGSW